MLNGQISLSDTIQEDYIVCLICGQKRKALASHLRKIHKISADDYKRKFGYNLRTGLSCHKLTEWRRQDAIDRNLAGMIRNNPVMTNQVKRKGHRRHNKTVQWRENFTAMLERKKQEREVYLAEKYKEVLAFLAQGLQKKEIAKRMGVSTTLIGSWLRNMRANGMYPDVRYRPLDRIDFDKLANEFPSPISGMLCLLKDFSVHLELVRGEKALQTNSGDLFVYSLDGILLVELENRTARLQSMMGMGIPKGKLYRLKSNDEAVALIVKANCKEHIQTDSWGLPDVISA